MFSNLDDLLHYCERECVEFINFKVVDRPGRWHQLSIPAERFNEGTLSEGIGFDGSSYGFLTVEKSDMVFRPDLSTAFLDPFTERKTLVMIADIYRLKGSQRIRFEDDPRFIAQKTERILREKGIADEVFLGPEFEFYVLDKVAFRNEINHMEVYLDSAQSEWNSGLKEGGSGLTVPAGGGYHLDIPFDTSCALRNEAVRLLESVGVPVKYHHSENGGPGQVEIEVSFDTLLRMADGTQKLKYVVRNEALRQGKTVTFMPKPFAREAGSSMHVHLYMMKGGEPVFYDEKGYSGLSKTALHAIGGVLQHTAALMAFTNPSTNSYKRLVPGYEAPVNICFGTANRSAVIRIPAYATRPEQKRFELRSPDGTANPYFAFSAIVLAAMDGIINETDPNAHGFGPIDKDLYTMSYDEKAGIKALPANLAEAAQALEEDHEFLKRDGVFTENLIKNQIRSVLKDHYEVNSLPHPEEFRKYYHI